MSLKLVLVLCAVWQVSQALNLFNINSAPVRTLSRTDDGTASESVSGNGFPFFGNYHSTLFVGMNGIVSFDRPVTHYDTRGWPTASYSIGTSAILPFWSDVNGFHTGNVHFRPAAQQELATFANTLVTSRPTLSGINLKYGMLYEWNDITPCGCYFPKNTVQMALVTDGCTSYALLAYPKVNWGNDEGARVGYLQFSPQNFHELSASQTRTLQSLPSSNHVLYFGGENVCTGQPQGTLLPDPTNSSIYHLCGECSVANSIHCAPGKTYDPQCQACVVNPHPHCDRAVDGQWGAWSDSSQCTATCGPLGTKQQTRLCNNPAPSNGGKSCPGSATQTISCNTGINCPINGGYSAWYDQTQCTVSCGGGTKQQGRDCNNPFPQFGGLTCAGLGPNTQTVSCGSANCPINGFWGPWTNDGTCDKTCGTGQQRQTRVCNPPRFGGLPCPSEPNEQFIPCNTQRCPDVCTNADALDNQFVQVTPTFYCLCERLPDNSLSYIKECITCSSGTVYNPAIQSCSSPVDFQCLADPFCADKAEGDYSIWHGHTNASCSHLYYHCDAQKQMTQRSCGVSSTGNYFNAVSRTCVAGIAHTTCPNNDCVGRSNGNYERFSDLCTSYLQCSNFVEIVRNCPTSIPYYNQVTRTCVAATGPNNNNPPAGQNCIDPDCLNKADGFYVVDNRCNAFYQCQNQREIQWTTCNVNEYYNAATRQCSTVYPSNNLCQHKYCIQNSNLVAGTFQLSGSSCLTSYSSCSGATSANGVPNILSDGVCQAGTYFQITNSNTFAGSCANVPAPQTCPNWQCIGRNNGYRIAFTGFHSCRQYYECQNGILTTQTCPTDLYYDPNSNLCTSAFDEARCQHPDCLPGGRQGSPGNYPIKDGSQCSHQYYQCTANLLRVINSCPFSLTGNYFGQNANQVWTCLTGKSPVGCLNRDCVGRIVTNSQTQYPLYYNPNNLYCRGYYSCPVTNGNSVYDVCPNNGYYFISTYRCDASFPTTQSCRVDGGISLWSVWSYALDSSCSETCGTHGFQLQVRSRQCNNPLPQNGGSDCPGLSRTEFRNFTCEAQLPACGHAFCQNRAAGSYSKSLLNDPPTSTSCYKDYLICSGPPANTLTFSTCTDADYYFNPTLGSCQRGQGSNCPACAGVSNGFYAFATSSHDCMKFLNCTNEYATTMTCQKVLFNGEERETYFNPTTRTCERIPSYATGFCNPVVGYWSAWVSDGAGCSIRSNGLCQSRQIRTCNDPTPVNSPGSCPGSSEQFITCASGSCGDAFCIGRPAGLYSKSLQLPTPLNLACFSEYYQCSGAPANKLTVLDCTDADYIFDPALGACRRGSADALCPNTKCAARADGLYAFDTLVHDCRNYVNCTNELSTVLTCQVSVNGKPTYWNPNTQTCTEIPSTPQLCNFVQGFWGAWFNIDSSCTRINGQCVIRRQRSCNNPSPIGDPTACGGQSIQTQSTACADSQCPLGCSTNPCPTTADCVDVVGGGFQCNCKAGYTQSSGSGSTIVCVDIDECAVNPLICGTNQLCENTIGGHNCRAPYCQSNTNPCTGSNAVCVSTNISPGYVCSCLSGYTLSGSGTSVTCTDIDECLSNNGNCGSTSVCVNLPGTFRCEPDYCASNPNPCSSNYVCQSTSTSPGYTCVCPSPQYQEVFVNNVNVCQDVNECLVNNGGCGSFRVCTNTVGGFFCQTQYCTAAQPSPCLNSNVLCTATNVLPGYTCTCPATGFTSSGTGINVFCSDINECTAGTDNCLSNQVCVNTVGSFFCQTSGCSANSCPSNADCTDVLGGGFTCACKSGYTQTGGSGSGIVCEDINECLTNNGGCGLFRVCENTPGSFICQAQYCTVQRPSPCTDPNSVCTATNVFPGYTCTCPSGFTLSGSGSSVVCTDINECLTNNGGCLSNQVCSNTVGSFSCLPSYCENNPNPCTGANAQCVSSSVLPGYQCTCPQGYTASGTGANVVCTLASGCSGKNAGFRIADSTSGRHYYVCDGNGGQTRASCPNAELALGINPTTFDDVLVPNGIWFHPLFLTCVNTTTGQAPATPVLKVDGTPDYERACSDIANLVNVAGEQVSTQLPLDPPGERTCYHWLGCQDQQLVNSQLNPPIAGTCNSGGYDRDQRSCNPTDRFTCPV